MRLDDGRRLGYHLLGEPSGEPVVAIDGIGVRWMLRFGRSTAGRTGSKLIVVDRPGHGGSDPGPVDHVGGLAGDVCCLLDELGHTRCF